MSRRSLPPPIGHRGGARALAMAGALGLLAGCSMLGDGDPKLRIEPLYKVRHSAGSSHGHYLTGRYYDGMGAWQRAIDAYRKAIAADPGNVEAHNALGAALAQAGRHGEAEAVFRTGVALDPARAHLRSNLGYLLLLEGRLDDALVQLENAVRLDPANAVARNNLQQVRARQAGAGEAVRAEVAPPPAVVTSPVATREFAPAIPLSSSPLRAPAARVQEGERSSAPPLVAPAARLRVIDRPTVPAYLADVSAPPSGIEVQMPRQVIQLLPMAHETRAEPARPPVPPPPPTPIAKLEVSNGNGISGAAARLRRWLAEHGTATHRLTNHRPFTQRETVIQYRSGHEAAAQRLASILPLSGQPVTVLASGLRSDVRVILGHDWARIAACVERADCPTPAATVATR